MAQIIKLKRGLKARLEATLIGANKPQRGEPIWEIDTNKLKIGDGTNNYADLPYIGGESSMPQVVFGSRYEFPGVGEENKLYVAKDEQNSYIWNNGYVLVSVDGREIDAGGADAQY